MQDKRDKSLRILDMYVRLCEGKLINKTEEAKQFGVDILKLMMKEKGYHCDAEALGAGHSQAKQASYVFNGREGNQSGGVTKSVAGGF